MSEITVTQGEPRPDNNWGWPSSMAVAQAPQQILFVPAPGWRLDEINNRTTDLFEALLTSPYRIEGIPVVTEGGTRTTSLGITSGGGGNPQQP